MFRNNFLFRTGLFMDADGGAAGGSGTAGSGNGDSSSSSGNGSGSTSSGSTDPKSMTFDEFLKQGTNQSEFDRRMNKGIETAVSKESARLRTVFDSKLDEQDRLSKMTDAERAAYQENKKTSALAQREAEITKRELLADAKNTFAEKGLPVTLADIVNYTSKENCDDSISKIEKAFKDAVAAAVEEKLKGDKPPKDAKTSETNKDKDEISKEVMNALKGVR